MIIDRIQFYADLDQLELRFNCHDSFVDKFLVSEFACDYHNNPKPLYFIESGDRFQKFADKILYVSFNKFPSNFTTLKQKAGFQRDLSMDYLLSFADEDLIINTDLDEILKPDTISRYTGGIMQTEMSLFVYYINLYGGRWCNGSICSVKDLRGKKLSELRYNGKPGFSKYPFTVLKDCGWHFSWLGGREVIKDKYRNFGFDEGWPVELNDDSYIDNLLKNRIKFWDNLELEIKEIDNTYPKYLFTNQSKYKKYIYEKED